VDLTKQEFDLLYLLATQHDASDPQPAAAATALTVPRSFSASRRLTLFFNSCSGAIRAPLNDLD
jgi:hypothetical protein